RIPVTATITTAPTVNLVITPDTIVCDNETVSISAASANDPNYKYTWSFNGMNVHGSGSAFSFQPSQDTTVYFTAEDTVPASPNFGCVFLDVQEYTVHASVDTPIISP